MVWCFYIGAAMSTPALRLPATLEKFVADQVELGAYRSREAAIVAAEQVRSGALTSAPGCKRSFTRDSIPSP